MRVLHGGPVLMPPSSRTTPPSSMPMIGVSGGIRCRVGRCVGRPVGGIGVDRGVVAIGRPVDGRGVVPASRIDGRTVVADAEGAAAPGPGRR
jgi:hypothetical protein